MEQINQSIYIDNGYYSRKHYLKCLAEEHCVPEYIVTELAHMLGPNEDFDGLICELEDAAMEFEGE